MTTANITIRKSYADTPKGQIHYRYAVPPTPSKKKYPLLLLHMSASSSLCWEPLMRIYAARGYTCYAPDMPGFGGSFDPAEGDDPGAVGIGWYVELYADLFFPSPSPSSSPTLSPPPFAESCARGVHILGHHSGGVLGLELAGHPRVGGLVRSLSSVGPAIMMDRETQAEMGRKVTVPFNAPAADGSHLQRTWGYLRRAGEGIQIPAESESGSGSGSRGGGEETVGTGWKVARGTPDYEEAMRVLHTEALDHARAWRGRLQIYSCVFGPAHDSPTLLRDKVKCRVLAMCARDDVLWPMFGNVRTLRPGEEDWVQMEEIKGGNFGPSRDVGGIEKVVTPFLEKVEAEN